MRRSDRLTAKPACPPAWASLMTNDDSDDEEKTSRHRRSRRSAASRQQLAPKQQRPAPYRERRPWAAGDPLPPEILLMSVSTIENSIERWQAATGLALAGAFGPAPRTFLEPFWLEEAQSKAQPGETVTRGPFHSATALRDAGIAAGLLPLGGGGLTVAQMANLVPESVPVSIMRAVSDDLPRQRVRAALRAEGMLEEFMEHPLVQRYLATGNPGLPSVLDQLRRVRRERVLHAELAQHGVPLLGVVLNDEWFAYVRMGIGRPASIVTTIVRRHHRRQELIGALGDRGLQLRSDSKLCEAYIERGAGNMEEIVDIMDEMRFYHR